MKYLLLMALVWHSAAASAAEDASDYVAQRKAAMALLKAGEHQAALTAFKQMLASAGTDFQRSDALRQAAMCAGQLQQFDRAMELAQRIPLQPYSKLCQLQLLENQREWRQIVQKFQDEPFADWPESLRGEAWFGRGHAYFAIKQGEAAAADLLLAADYLTDGNSLAVCLHCLGDTYATLLDDDEQAIASYRRVYGRGNIYKHCQSAISVAAILQQRGQHQAAIDELSPLNVEELVAPYWRGKTLSALGAAYVGAGKDAAAISAYRQALETENLPEALRQECQTALDSLKPELQDESTKAGSNGQPNIIVVLCDDLGYGDIHCNNPLGKIATPHADRLAAEGMRFTDAHTTSSVCSPTRYSLLTGRYNWRSRLQSGVLGGLSPRLIETDRLTVASLLQGHGYHTACIGKWHLGMNWTRVPNTPDPPENSIETTEHHHSVDYTQPISSGPNSVGFDEYFGISASLDMVPYTFIENGRVAAIPNQEISLAMSSDRPQRQTRRGPGAEGFTAEKVLPTLTQKAVDYIAERAKAAHAGEPFFLYLPLASPHTPIAPAESWRGRSQLNAYADFVMQTDDCLGQLLAALDQHKLADNTLLLFTSDNGCSPEADIPALKERGHAVNGPLRGHKADLWEGGHRVPFIVRWPGRVAAGKVNDQLVSLVDLMATCSELCGDKLPDDAGEDSLSLLPTLTGDGPPLRKTLISHSISGKFAIRQGSWKLCLTPGSGGWSQPNDAQAARQGDPDVQLYDLANDLPESRNLQAEHPDVVARLTKLLLEQVSSGRSTPGTPQSNSREVDVWKKK